MIHPRTGQEVSQTFHNCNAYCNAEKEIHADIARSDVAYELDEVRDAMVLIHEIQDQQIEVLEVREAPEADPYIRHPWSVGPFEFRYLVIWRNL